MKKIYFTLAILILFLNAAKSQDTLSKKPAPKFLIGGAAEFGGDDVAEIAFTNGDTQGVKAGQGISLYVGLEFPLVKNEILYLRSALGFKYVTTKADNAHIRLTRFPITNTLNTTLGKNVRLGAGLSWHTGINFNADGIGDDIDFDAAMGPIFEVAYKGFGISYTVMKYKDSQNFRYNANSFGITMSGTLNFKNNKPKR